MKSTYLILIVLAVMAVAFADVFLKKAALLGSMSKAIQSPWMILAVLLYLFQVVIFTDVFVHGAKLGYVGIIQTVLYAVIVLLWSFFFYHEHMSPIQIVGIIVALVGVVLINL